MYSCSIDIYEGKELEMIEESLDINKRLLYELSARYIEQSYFLDCLMDNFNCVVNHFMRAFDISNAVEELVKEKVGNGETLCLKKVLMGWFHD